MLRLFALFGKIFGPLGLLISLIFIVQLYFRHQKIQEYQREGRHVTGTVIDKQVSYFKTGKNTYQRLNYVNLQVAIDGQQIHTPLDETRDVIDDLRVGQPLEVVYLEKNKWNANGQVGFYDERRPVPLAFVQQQLLASPFALVLYGVLVVSLGLLLAGRRAARTRAG